ncbi:MAG: DMT family transporter, partial [Paracoccaceae bacterium]|nr:DMT family transporter [Paracoccaceae bacterium]
MSILENKAFQFALLAATGAAWGLTNPLTKVAVSTGYQPLGIMFWQLVIVAVFSGGFLVLRKRRPPLHKKALVLYAVIALVGTIIPDFLVYTSAVHIPAGILSIIMAIAPMLSLPIALLLRIETFSVQRMFGAILGLVAIVLMVGPKDGLANATEAFFALVVLCAAGFYALQGHFIT